MGSHSGQGSTNLEAFPAPPGGAATKAPTPPREPAEPVSKVQAPAPAEAVPSQAPSSGGAVGRTLKYMVVALLGAACGGAAAYYLKPPPIPETVFVNFDAQSAPKGLLGDGWSPVFEQFKDGVTFSWCSALRCTLNVESDAKHERLIRARLMPFRFDRAPAQTVTVYLNGTKMDRPACRGRFDDAFLPGFPAGTGSRVRTP